MRIYVGNVPNEATEEDIRQAFAAFGKVTFVTIKRFAFVDMPVTTEAQAAIVGLDGKHLKGRMLTVSEARPRSQRPAAKT
jgi:RNA recognition motif-containing protein